MTAWQYIVLTAAGLLFGTCVYILLVAIFGRRK